MAHKAFLYKEYSLACQEQSWHAFQLNIRPSRATTCRYDVSHWLQNPVTRLLAFTLVHSNYSPLKFYSGLVVFSPTSKTAPYRYLAYPASVYCLHSQQDARKKICCITQCLLDLEYSKINIDTNKGNNNVSRKITVHDGKCYNPQQ